MRHLFRLAPVLLCLAACQSNPSTPAAADAVAAPAAAKPEPVKVEPANPEHIEASMVTVNGQPQMELSTKPLMRQLGRPGAVPFPLSTPSPHLSRSPCKCA